MTDRVFAGADELSRKIQDLRWQVARDLIETYGRECYNLGAQALLDRLAQEMAEEPCPKCGDPNCKDRVLVPAQGRSEERVPLPEAWATALDQADGSPERCI